MSHFVVVKEPKSGRIVELFKDTPREYMAALLRGLYNEYSHPAYSIENFNTDADPSNDYLRGCPNILEFIGEIKSPYPTTRFFKYLMYNASLIEPP